MQKKDRKKFGYSYIIALPLQQIPSAEGAQQTSKFINQFFPARAEQNKQRQRI